ncbi:MAG: hypothetical protein ACFFB2_05490 [Promethearchaeota archaeon]
MISKFLDNPISILILKLLTKKQLTIPQITKSLHKMDTDIPTVIAVLGECYHFGLVERVKIQGIESPVQNHFSPEMVTTPLGIPLHEYVSLWEEVLQHPDQLNSKQMHDWIFSVPSYLRNELENLTEEEIRVILLKRAF